MYNSTRYILNKVTGPAIRTVAPLIGRDFSGLIAAAAVGRVSYFYMKRLKYPSGPIPYPVVGNLKDLLAVDGCFYRATEKWGPKHGEIFTVWLGENPWIFVNSLEAILEANDTSKQHLFAGRHRTNTGDVQMRGNIGVIFSDYTVEQQALRHIAEEAIRRYQKKKVLRHKNVQDVVHAFLEAENGGFMESKNIAEKLVQRAATMAMFGASLEPEKQKALREAHRDLEMNCPSGLPSDVLPVFRYIFWRRELNGLRAFSRYESVAKELCVQAYDRFHLRAENDIDSVMDAVFQTVNETKNRPGYFDKSNTLQILFDLFQAGSQTSVITLHWALLKLASDQELQQKLYEEIVAYVIETGAPPQIRQTNILPRLQSFLKEISRYWPAAPFGLPRRLSQTTKIGKYVLPANSTVLFNLYRGNRDPTYWRDGGVFNPERFLDQDGHFDDRPHRGFLTFGLGSRSCIGNELATDNLFFTLAMLLEQRKVLPHEDGISLDPHPAALMLDAKIQKIKLQKRY